MHCFKVLKILENLTIKKKSFWKLIRGMNMYNCEDGKLYLNPRMNTKINNYYIFQDALISLMV